MLYIQKKLLTTSKRNNLSRIVFGPEEISVAIASDKKRKSIESCKTFLKRDSFTIRKLSVYVGTLTSTFPGNKFGSLYSWDQDKCKTFGLKKAKVNFVTLTNLTEEDILDLQWWIKLAYSVKKGTVPRY